MHDFNNKTKKWITCQISLPCSGILPSRHLIKSIQDIKNPEYYIGIGRRTHGYSVCKYRDHLEDDEDFDDMDQIYFERQPIIGITIPGELSLDFPSETLQCLIHIYDPIPKSHLRLHDMIEVVGIVESNSLESVPPYEEERNYPITSNDLPVDQPKKKQKVESNDLSFEEEELLSMVSSYQNTSTSYSHVFTISHQQYLRIHCLFYYPISPSFPFYSSLCDPNTLLEYDIACSDEASSIVQSFTSILQDSLVSQYLTLALISSVYNRVDSGKSVGNLPLNIWNTNSISSDTFQQLISFIRKIVPRTYVVGDMITLYLTIA